MDFEAFLLSHQLGVRFSIFLGILGVMAVWELAAPRRRLSASKVVRWLSNLSIVFLNGYLLRLISASGAVGVAGLAHQKGWGLFNVVEVPYGLEVVLSIVILDGVIYLQHVMFHAVPVLWRLHRVHHADLDIDVTTGARFHPIEIVISMYIKFAAILLLGPAAVAVLVFEILLNGTALFNHANVYLPKAVDAALRLVLVTPDMHRVHHSTRADETNSNFGFNLPWWDYLFGTYTPQPAEGHRGMTIGVSKHRDPKRVSRLPGMLLLPFSSQKDEYAINSRKWM
jgi:sterol desaturase/sphingolipid hydroxylase (fatty acid hydroxylase superfamily)